MVHRLHTSALALFRWQITEMRCRCQIRRRKRTLLSMFDYGCLVLGDCGEVKAQSLDRLQKQTMRIIMPAHRKLCTQDMRSNLGLI